MKGCVRYRLSNIEMGCSAKGEQMELSVTVGAGVGSGVSVGATVVAGGVVGSASVGTGLGRATLQPLAHRDTSTPDIR